MFARELQREGFFNDIDLLMPVPMHRWKQWKRGFNQAEKIARHLGRRIGVPVLPRAVIRHKNTTAQRSLSAEDRYFNLEGAFSLNPGDAERIKGSRKMCGVGLYYNTSFSILQCYYCL